MKSSELIYLDLVGGIAGDMFVAAMIDCDSSLKEKILASVGDVLPAEAGSINIFPSINKGISGLRFEFVQAQLDEQAQATESSWSKPESTTYTYLDSLIQNSQISDSTKLIAHDLLTTLAKSEAKIHQKPIESVHFHELADWDSLMDIVAIATILDAKHSATWQISDIPIGRGRVSTAHGLLPVPAPATLDLLTGFEFIDDGQQGERVTPTGAVILRYLRDSKRLIENSASSSTMQLTNIGYGLGKKTFKTLPNILRASRFNQKYDAKVESETQVAVMSFEVDDMTGEEVAVALDQLRDTDGVIDVCVASVRGKKSRHMESVQILAEPSAVTAVADACFIFTSTIGLRTRIESRQCLDREHLETEHGQVKTVLRPDNTQTAKLESDALNTRLSLQARRAKKFSAEFKDYPESKD